MGVDLVGFVALFPIVKVAGLCGRSVGEETRTGCHSLDDDAGEEEDACQRQLEKTLG